MTIFERALVFFFGFLIFIVGLVGAWVTCASIYTGIALGMPLGALIFAIGSGACLWLGWALLAAGFQRQKGPAEPNQRGQ